ncbi:MAG: hypothetical protein ACI85U_003234 [Candidatus Promineifilaceae bacterium]|jgi:hypothetical protein
MEKKFYLNQDHQKVSVAVPLLLVIFIVVGYRLFYSTLPSLFGGQSSDYILIAGIVSLFTSAFILWLLDPVIKRFLPSGHVLVLDSQNGSLTYLLKEEVKTTLEDRPNWNVTRWNFLMGRFVKSGRERQIPKTWSCMALVIQAEAEELVLFCYAPPKTQRKLSQMIAWETISMYDTIEDDPKTRNLPMMRAPTVSDVIPGKLLVGEKGKIWLSERKRRDNGIEMTPKDFEQLVVYLSS